MPAAEAPVPAADLPQTRHDLRALLGLRAPQAWQPPPATDMRSAHDQAQHPHAASAATFRAAWPDMAATSPGLRDAYASGFAAGQAAAQAQCQGQAPGQAHAQAGADAAMRQDAPLAAPGGQQAPDRARLDDDIGGERAGQQADGSAARQAARAAALLQQIDAGLAAANAAAAQMLRRQSLAWQAALRDALADTLAGALPVWWQHQARAELPAQVETLITALAPRAQLRLLLPAAELALARTCLQPLLDRGRLAEIAADEALGSGEFRLVWRDGAAQRDVQAWAQGWAQAMAAALAPHCAAEPADAVDEQRAAA